MAADIKDEMQIRREEAKIALFIDFENIALGVREAKYKMFEVNKVLERLVEKGKIVFKKAYADWDSYAQYKRPFHEAAIELVYIPRKVYSGKNSADIRMVVDAMDLSYSKEHIDIFVVASGDSDFSPLVSKLKENRGLWRRFPVMVKSKPVLSDRMFTSIALQKVWQPGFMRPIKRVWLAR